MTAPMTPEREQEIRTREQAATPGPWMSDGAEIYGTLGGAVMLDLWVGETLDIDNEERSNADAAFIATAREAVPELLAEISDLRARVAELEARSPWERAVAGLNALADANIAFWIEPDGHISGPFGDEHIEWDQKASRWRLVHDDEHDEDPTVPDPLAYGPSGYRCGCGKDAHSNLTPCQPMTADEWNEQYPVGTPVAAYPVTRDDEALTTVTRSRAWALGHGAAVVSVEGYSGGIHLTHVDPIEVTA